MKEQWVVGIDDSGGWTYPGKVTVANDSFVVFEIQDSGGAFEIHRAPNQVRPAKKEDFDRQILDLSKSLVSSEELIAKLEGIQKHAPN